MNISKKLKKIALNLEIGDEILIGKFKNVPAVIKEFSTDKNNQPTVKTNKGVRSLYNFRIKKLMDNNK